jgi:hypothetical protein
MAMLKAGASIARMSLRDAKFSIINMIPPLQDHLVKLAIYGDRYGWKQEVVAFVDSIQNVRLKLKTREYLAEEEYQDTLRQWHDVGNESPFVGAARVITQPMLNLQPKRTITEAQPVVLAWQNELCRLWSQGKATEDVVLQLLNNA